jgi:hypothetical protein
MTSESRRGLSARCRGAVLGFVMAMLVGELALHNLVAKAYYDFNLKRLELVAVVAASAGARYLPGDPDTAVRITRSSARRNGVARDEIVFVRTSSDNVVLTIRLDRKIPRYMAFLVMGLPARDISVTVSARKPDVDSGHYTSVAF